MCLAPRKVNKNDRKGRKKENKRIMKRNLNPQGYEDDIEEEQKISDVKEKSDEKGKSI